MGVSDNGDDGNKGMAVAGDGWFCRPRRCVTPIGSRSLPH